MKDFNPISNLVWHRRNKKLYINLSKNKNSMPNGIEFNTYLNDSIEIGFGSKDEIVSIYDLMSTFESSSIEEECKIFENLIELYKSDIDDNYDLAIEMLGGAAENFVNKNPDKFISPISKLYDLLKK